jgi:AhpD family alkylhydroperoxidase
MSNDSGARIDWTAYARLAPDVVAALAALGKAVDDSGLEKGLTELLKVRASQLNGCAFCLQYHLNQARKEAIAGPKLDLLATWRDTAIFSNRERAALAWTEALTGMNQAHIPEHLYRETCEAFEPAEVAHLTASVAAINAWNRIAGALRFTPPIPASAN